MRCEKRLCESSKKGEEEEEKTSCRHHLKVYVMCGVCCNDFTTDFQSSMNTFTSTNSGLMKPEKHILQNAISTTPFYSITLSSI